MSNMPPNDPNSNLPNSDQNPLGQPPVKQDGNPYATPTQQQQPYATMPQNDGDATGGIIPYKNPKALIAYYTSIFSLLLPPLGFVAVILGILGLMDRKKNPAIKGSVHAWIGIVLGTITMLCGGALIATFIIGAVQAAG